MTRVRKTSYWEIDNAYASHPENGVQAGSDGRRVHLRFGVYDGRFEAADPLPSWNDGPAKQSIIAFVEKVTKPGSPDFVPVPERIATFDNDGTLWCEQPVPVQLYFALIA